MSRVIDGGNVAQRYQLQAAYLAGFLSDGDELPEGLKRSWEELFNYAKYGLFLNTRAGDEDFPEDFEMSKALAYFAAERLVIDCYRSARELNPKEAINRGEVIEELRGLTRKLIESGTSDYDKKTNEFMTRFYFAMMGFGEQDAETESHGVAGKYSFGTRDFEDD